MSHTLPELPYGYADLEPSISREVMELHHKKHHQTYVDKLNAALETAPAALQSMPLEQLISNLESVPTELRQAVRNHGGGHYNHSLFWQCMTPDGGGRPGEKLLSQLTEKYGSLDEFCAQFEAAATALFGSGWVWLTPTLEIVSLPNQDNPLMQGGQPPLMGLDVWEHAYYLDYKNKRDEYIKNWWQVVNWQFVDERFETLSE